jgi:hypothetical protein
LKTNHLATLCGANLFRLIHLARSLQAQSPFRKNPLLAENIFAIVTFILQSLWLGGYAAKPATVSDLHFLTCIRIVGT